MVGADARLGGALRAARRASPSQLDRVERLLDIDRDRCVVVPNGYDPERFSRRDVDRATFCGPSHGGVPGDRTILLYVGRFTEVKRMGLLVRAYARARERFERPAALVFVGGHDGEWEVEHPGEVAQELGLDDVFLAGWQEHEALPDFYSAADVSVLASICEQFGLVLVEGMACELPPIAVGRYGPADIVTPGETGWLVAPRRRGGAGRRDRRGGQRSGRAAPARQRPAQDVAQRFAWPSIAQQLGETLAQAAAGLPA